MQKKLDGIYTRLFQPVHSGDVLVDMWVSESKFMIFFDETDNKWKWSLPCGGLMRNLLLSDAEYINNNCELLNPDQTIKSYVYNEKIQKEIDYKRNENSNNL